MDKIDLRKQIENLFDQGFSITTMTELLNITENTVKVNLPSEKLKDRIFSLVEQGYSYSQIGEKLGFGSSTISSYVKGSDTENRVSKGIVSRFKDGESVDAIANDYAMSKQGILRFIPESIRFERLKDLYVIKQLSFSETAKQLGIGRTSLKNWLNESGLDHRNKSTMKLIKEYPEEDIVRDYFKLKSIETIVKERGVYKNKVSKILRNRGIQTYKDLNILRRHVNGEFLLGDDQEFKEIAFGELLGDFSIESLLNKAPINFIESYTTIITYLREYTTNETKELNPKEFANYIEKLKLMPLARLKLTCSILEAPWVFYLSDLFLRHNVKVNISIIKIISQNSYQLTFSTREYVQIAEYYRQWYQNGVKTIPRDLVLTPLMLLHWYIGDGSYTNSIMLSTNGFTVQDVKFLIKLLKRDLGIESRLYETPTGPTIKIYKRDQIKKFFETLGQAGERTQFCKTFFPWKFNTKTKKDTLKSVEYKKIVKNYLLKRNKEINKRVVEYIENY